MDPLLDSSEPSIRYKFRVGVLGEDPASSTIRSLREEIRITPRVQTLLAASATLDDNEEIHVYQKWRGAHWALAALADLGYPTGDAALIPIRDRVLDVWLDPKWFQEFQSFDKADSYKQSGVPVMEGRHRRCASQQGNALFAIVSLGLADPRTDGLVDRLLHWQWPDGGWNCDRRPSADTSSFMETLTPLRGLAAYHKQKPDAAVAEAITRAAEVFLERQLFRRRSDGGTIRPEFTKLHYPLYWHFDILGGLKVLAEAGMIHDLRCEQALDLLVQKQLPDGGFPAEAKHYRVSETVANGNESVDWGGVRKGKANPWVTVDALTTLAAAGRLP